MMLRKDCEKRIGVAVLLAAAVAGLAAGPASGATFALWREAVVDGGNVSVGDVCRIGQAGAARESMAAVVIAAAPDPGKALAISADEVRRALRDSGVNPATIVIKGAATCAVRRPQAAAQESKAVRSDAETPGASGPGVAGSRSLRQVIEAFFAAEAPAPGSTVAVRFGRANEDALDLSEPKFAFRIQRTSTQSLGMVSLKVTVFERGDVIKEFPMLVDVSRIVPVVVAARPINLGAIIGAGDLHMMDMSFSQGDQPGFTEMEAVIGQRARHFIAAGEPVLARELETVPLVKRGQLVDVQSSVGGVSIMTAAQALSDGAYGDVVGLRADGSNRRQVSAIVIGPGRVRIGGGDAELAMGGER